MEENILEDRVLYSRYRSPCFRKNEVKTLIQLVEQYKHIILNKSTNANANYAKDRAWEKVATEFNRYGLGLERSPEVLKTKWENLKRSARKLGKDVMNGDSDYNKDDISKTVAMICIENGQNEFDGDKSGNNYAYEKEDVPLWPCDDDLSLKIPNDTEQQNSSPLKSEPRIGYTPKDCQVLLQCVRQEKNVLFGKSNIVKRHRAWKRVAQVYNKQSPQKRTAKELNRKFNAMKAMAKKVNIKGYFRDIKMKKYEQLDTSIDQKIKSEPIVESTEDYDHDSDSDKELPSPDNTNLATNSSRLSFNDPLSHVHSSDSGLGSISGNKGSERLKVELLQYQMETARLHRKQIEDAIKSHELERQMRELEHSLRLRAARLEIIAAESKIPSSHPARHYTPQERRAQLYLDNAELDIG